MKYNCSLRPLVDHFQSTRPLNWTALFERDAPITVEIGFGLGEVLIQRAGLEPEVNFVGIEENWERIYKTLNSIDRVNPSLENIRILRCDAKDVFERMFLPRSIAHMYCLFPCPWPKKSHAKHRLFSKHFLRLVNNRLKDFSSLQIVSDHKPYIEWIDEQLAETGFEVRGQTVGPQYNTKFERKWRAQGQEQFFELILNKTQHIEFPVVEDCAVKSFMIDQFDPEQFTFEDVRAEVTVSLKDKIYDPQQERMLLHLVVAEQKMAQHFWVSIKKEGARWRMGRLDGQNFFATPGIVEALDILHRSLTGKKN